MFLLLGKFAIHLWTCALSSLSRFEMGTQRHLMRDHSNSKTHIRVDLALCSFSPDRLLSAFILLTNWMRPVPHSVRQSFYAGGVTPLLHLACSFSLSLWALNLYDNDTPCLSNKHGSSLYGRIFCSVYVDSNSLRRRFRDVHAKLFSLLLMVSQTDALDLKNRSRLAVMTLLSIRDRCLQQPLNRGFRKLLNSGHVPL